MKRHLLLLLFLTSSFAYGEELQSIEIIDVQDHLTKRGQVKDSIVKTEVITQERIQKKNAQNLIQAIEQEPGLQILNGCSICGIKQVQINGLRGEYTTVLVDGIPLHSTVSSYYGFEALGTLGVAAIEVSRGSGAALSAPEAIGGVLNIVTQKAKENKTIIDVSGGNHDYQNLTVVSTAVGDNGRRRTTIAAQYSKQGQWDEDNNGINETPKRDTRSAMVKYSQDLGEKLNFDLRLNTLKASIFGGPMNRGTFETTGQASTPIDYQSFKNGDVRSKYIGEPGSTAEIVDVDRNEAALKVTHATNSKLNLQGTASYARTTQDSFYEGADYKNLNEAFFYDLKGNYNWNDTNLMTLGFDYKLETLKSKSHAFFEDMGRDSDSFDYSTPGVYLQDIWIPNDQFEISMALRLNHVMTNFTDKTAKKNEINDTIFAPRAHILWRHSPSFESRIAYGKGYRSPLTFFESEHGLLDDGFDVEVSRLETSDSYTYALTHTTSKTTTTVGGAWTKVKDISYIDDSGSIPALRNLEGKKVEVANIDGSFGIQVTPELKLGLTAEKYFYQDLYKELLIVAAVEERVSFLADWDYGKWDISTTVTWTGTRDLHKYGYDDRYDRYDGTNASSKKRRFSPSFITTDINFGYEFTKDLTIYFGAKNLFDYTQSESPLYFSSNGDFDVANVWGPLQGRQFYLGAKSVF